MAKLRWVGLLILCLVLAACASTGSTPQRVVPTRAAMESATGYSAVDKSSGGTTNVSDSNNTTTDVQRLVIMNANLSIVVDDPAKTMEFITNLATTLNGYVVSSNLSRYTSSSGVDLPAANITIRVPAEELNNALTQIKSQVKDPTKDIRSENVTGQDVTKEYTDLQSQLTNLQNAEAQLNEIMANATKTEDVLSIFNQLTQVQSQIEVLQGQIKYYEESAAMSAITVDIVAQASIQPITIAGWQPVGVAHDAIQTMIDGMQFLANAGIWAVLFCLPIFIVIGLPVWIIWRGTRRWRAERKAKRAQPASTLPEA